MIDKYNRSDLVSGLSHLEGISESQSRRVIDHIIEQIVYALLDGKTVYLPKLGSFNLVLRKTKKGVHPLKLIPLVVGPSLKVKFTVSITLKEIIKAHVDKFVEKHMSTLNSTETKDYYAQIEDVKEQVQDQLNSISSN